MSAFTIISETRTDLGKGASRRLRRLAFQVPAVVYGGEEKPQSLSILHKELYKATLSESFFSSIIDLSVDGKVQKVIIKDIQRHPSKQQILHVDFLRATAGAQLSLTVPLHFINEDLNEAIKHGGRVTHTMSQADITCDAAHLPEFLVIDMQHIAAGQIVHLSDIVLPEGIQIPALAQGEDHNQAVTTIVAKKVETDEDEAAAE
ncbi:MAG: large subunit ribosomal protein L25 [Motiliproteus sp.]|jgi:large subunit ribosomal protein L25